MTNKQTFPVHLDVEFSDADIDLHIMESGFATYPWWWGIEDGRDGYDIEAEDPTYKGDGTMTMSKTITYDDIRRAMSNMLANAYPNPDYYSLAKQQIFDGIMRNGDFDIDADGADEIMQCAFFGEVVYG